jgi:tetratricopeptide (TPR) repeat protein
MQRSPIGPARITARRAPVRSPIRWRRLVLFLVLVAVASGGAYGYFLRVERQRLAAADAVLRRTPVPRPRQVPRSWRWATEGEWVVHEVARALVSWSQLAKGDATAMRVSVQRKDTGDGPGVFEVLLSGGPQPVVRTIRPASHVWDPAAYAEFARELVGSPASPPEGGAIGAVDELLLTGGDSRSLRRADLILWRAIEKRPNDGALHAQAALLWALYAMNDADGRYSDERPFLNGLTTHLAIAAALGGTTMEPHQAVASAALDMLVLRQTDAVDALARFTTVQPPTALLPWARALTVRITRNAALPGPPQANPTRLEKLQVLRSLYRARSCRAAMEQARSWRLTPSGEWVRSLVEACSDPERSTLLQDFTALQTADAATSLDLTASEPAAVLQELQRVSSVNTHQPGRPQGIIPAHVRADAGIRHILSAMVLAAREMSRLAQPRAVRELRLMVEPAIEGLALRPLVEMAFDAALEPRSSRRAVPPPVCERLARLIADRPDLLPAETWASAEACASQSLLQPAARDNNWAVQSVPPGTGWLVLGPWRRGRFVSAAVLAEAAARAPWSPQLAQRWLTVAYAGEPPSATVRQAYAKVLDYDVWAMRAAVADIHDDEAVVEALAERICAAEVEACAEYGEYLASLGRTATAEKLYRHALAGAGDPIHLSNHLARYVHLLLDQRRVPEALRVAHRAADVHSAGGLYALALAEERLGRYDEAARIYAAITERYDDKRRENEFLVRYRQRYGEGRFAEASRRALAEVFPGGMHHLELQDFERQGHQGGVFLGDRMNAAWRRLGARPGDFLVALDGYTVESGAQLDVIETLSDDPRVRLIVFRGTGTGSGYLELTGACARMRYDRVASAR